MRDLIELPTFEGQSGTGAKVARCRVPKDLRLLYGFLIHIDAENDAAAAIDGKTMVDKIVIKADGVEKLVIKPTMEDFIRDLDNTSGDAFSASYIKVNLASAREGAGMSPWGTANIRTIEIEVHIQADATNKNFNGVRGWVDFRSIRADVPRGPIVRKKFVTEEPVTATGENQINALPVDELVEIQRLVFDSQYVTEVEIYLDGRLVRKLTKAANKALLEDDQTLTIAGVNSTFANYFPIVFDLNGQMGENLKLVDANGRRLPLQIVYKWTTGQALAAFDLFIQGVEAA